MEKITVEEVCKRYSLTLVNLAEEIGVSISLLSKIKNRIEPVTANTQFKFQKVYPDLELVGGKEKWKEMYKKAVEEIKEKEERISELESKIELYERRFKQIKDLSSEPYDNVYAIRKFQKAGGM